MNEVTKIMCPCGQENELVESPEGLRYNIKRHGNGELCLGKCFNCHAVLKGLAPEQEPVPEAEKTAKQEQAKEDKAEAKKKK